MEIETGRAKYILDGELCQLFNAELQEDFKALRGRKLGDEEMIRHLRAELTDEDIDNRLANCVSLILGVTEECNFRCRYCVYSGKYGGERTHTDKKMSLETAQKAVDFFFDLVNRPERRKKRYHIYIGFYGGEPLLEFDLVKKVIAYTKKAARENGLDRRLGILYRLTTNGYFLDEEKGDFFARENVLVDVSLDGPEIEHDKFRVHRDGHPTWKTVMKNLENIRLRHPDYYQERINYLITLHPGHDCPAIDRFFLENPGLFQEINLFFNQVSLTKLRPEEMNKWRGLTPTDSRLRFEQITQDLPQKFRLKFRDLHTPLTAACFPGGERIFVDTEGHFKICEKAGHELPAIGHVDRGFDRQQIRQILRSYNEEIIKHRCWECPRWFMCRVCPANSSVDGGFRFDCADERPLHRLLKKYLEQKEAAAGQDTDNVADAGFVDFLQRLPAGQPGQTPINGDNPAKLQLKPQVQAVKGARNYALYDLLTGNFFTIEPKGDRESLRRSLHEAGLVFETGGVVPFKVSQDISLEKEMVKIRKLQVRLNGSPEDNCWTRRKIGTEKRFLALDLLEHLGREITDIPVQRLIIEADDHDPEKIIHILEKFPYKIAELFVAQGLDEAFAGRCRDICRARGVDFSLLENGRHADRDLQVDVFDFFYRQSFNPCLGHQVAVDCGGEIKPCLWSPTVLGKIGRERVADLIMKGTFDPFWELTKDKIEVCKECELRYACPDCRHTQPAGQDKQPMKPAFCRYDPYRDVFDGREIFS